jgi:hypothetical protein
MLYNVHMITNSGRPTVLRAIHSLDRAMKVAAPGLRQGRIYDAWIVDEKGNECADLAAIKQHCGM